MKDKSRHAYDSIKSISREFPCLNFEGFPKGKLLQSIDLSIV